MVLNQRETIAQTIESIQRQIYAPIEFIVVDGASIDGTVEVLERLDGKIDQWISEPDSGPADASNKGIALAHGEAILFVNADDWLQPDYVERAMVALTKSDADFVFGNLAYYDGETWLYTLPGDPDYARCISYKMPLLNYPSILFRLRCFESVGLFDPSYKIANDYEWLLRLYRSGGKGVYAPSLTAHFRLGGLSSRNRVRGLIENWRASVAHGCSRWRASVSFFNRLARGAINSAGYKLLPLNMYRNTVRGVRKVL